MAAFDNAEYERLGQEMDRLAHEYHHTKDRAIIGQLAALTEKRAAILKGLISANPITISFSDYVAAVRLKHQPVRR